MKKGSGTGILFDDEARRRFMGLTGSRYDALVKRMEKKGIPVPFSKERFRAHILDALGGKYDGFVRCRYCSGFFNVVDIAADHEIPLSRGGSPGLDNIGFPCHPDNNRKGSLTPSEYLSLLEFLEKGIPLGRQDVLKRLEMAVKLAAGARADAAVKAELRKSGAWGEAQKRRAAARKAKEEAF